MAVLTAAKINIEKTHTDTVLELRVGSHRGGLNCRDKTNIEKATLTPSVIIACNLLYEAYLLELQVRLAL